MEDLFVFKEAAKSLLAASAIESDSLHEMCWRKGCNWDNLKSSATRGFCTYCREVTVDGRNGPVKWTKFFVDMNIPVFTSSNVAEWWTRFETKIMD